MTHPVLYEGGGNNLSEVDWDDPDIGEYIYLCPDKRRANFEYGSILIVHEAIRGPIEEAFSPQDRAPSKIKRDCGATIKMKALRQSG